MKKVRILLMVLGILLVGYAIFAWFRTSGLSLLTMDSHWGYILARTYKIAGVVGLISIMAGAALLFIRKPAGKTFPGDSAPDKPTN